MLGVLDSMASWIQIVKKERLIALLASASAVLMISITAQIAILQQHYLPPIHWLNTHA
jgi:hypothetical protein